jgi:hypothetical protein
VQDKGENDSSLDMILWSNGEVKNLLVTCFEFHPCSDSETLAVANSQAGYYLDPVP